MGLAVLEGHSAQNNIGDRLLFELKRDEAFRRIVQSAQMIRQQADILVIRGIMAMEQGKIAFAKSAFAEALGTWKNPDEVRTGGGIDFPARRVAEECLQLLSR